MLCPFFAFVCKGDVETHHSHESFDFFNLSLGKIKMVHEKFLTASTNQAEFFNLLNSSNTGTKPWSQDINGVCLVVGTILNICNTFLMDKEGNLLEFIFEPVTGYLQVPFDKSKYSDVFISHALSRATDRRESWEVHTKCAVYTKASLG